MVNFEDPAVVEQDIRAYAFSTRPWSLEGLMILSLNRGSQGPLAHHRWYLHVRMFRRRPPDLT